MAPLFHKKHLSCPDRVCLRLKQARKAKGITLKHMAEKTKINVNHLKALEECRFDALDCSSTYQKHFIKRYLETLGIDSAPFIEQYWKEELQYKPEQVMHPQKTFKNHRFNDLPHIMRLGVIGGTAIICVIYIGFQIFKTLKPPLLTVISPEDGIVTEMNTAIIKGITEPEVKLSVNGNNLKNNEEGIFSQTVALTPGVNTMVITAENKHGKTTEIVRRVIHKTPQQFSLSRSIDTL